MPNQATLNVNALRFRQSANCKHDYGGTVDAQSHCQLVQKFEDVPVESHADNGRGLHGPKFKASTSKPQRRLNFSRSSSTVCKNLANRPCARASRSHCQPHRKRESQWKILLTGIS